MELALRLVAEHAAKDNIYVGTYPLRSAQAQLASLPINAPVATRLQLLYQLAKLELNHGQQEQAINHYRAAEALLPDSGNSLPNSLRERLLFDMGVAYLRLGETQNCCQRNTPASCIVPIAGEGVHTRREGSTQAARYFERVLRQTDVGEQLHLASRWLLNVAHMTLGDYPQGVPAEFVIGRHAFASGQSFARFTNVAKKLGLDTFSLAGGAIADDFNNDGWIDLIVSSWNPSARLRIFFNRKGNFVEAGKNANLGSITGGLNLVQADYNNDGFIDILVLRGGWSEKQGQVPNSLLRNNGDETFTDVTFAAGLGDVHYPTQTAAWADYDLDGDLDLYIGNESSKALAAPCQLFRNAGNGTFDDVAVEGGVTNDRLAKAVAFGDYDGDRWPDIYVSNYRGANRLYRNRGNGTFEDIAAKLGVTQPHESFPVWFWDYDNDGDLDLFVAAYSGGVAEVAASLAELPFDKQKTLPRLYRNDGKGGFEDVAATANLVRPHHPMGANFGDVDADGFLDFYLGTGWPEYHELMPNAMYRNDAGKRFIDVTTAGGFGHLQKGHAIAFADFDQDGDLDVFEQMGGFVPGDKYFDALYKNPGNNHHWIELKLVGTHSCRSAIGARIRLDITDNGNQRSIYRYVSSGGSFGANPLAQFIGLGAADKVNEVEITWPRSGKKTRLQNVEVDRRLKITERE